MELVREIRRWGNSAGILLPKDMAGKEARVIVIERTLNIKKEIFEILSAYLEDILGIYLIGSYARNEQTERSDIDILAITNKTDKRIEHGKYSIILISKDILENQLKNNILPLLPMLKEAKPVLNSSLIENYKDSELTKKNLKWHIETTKSALKMNKAFIDFCKDYRRKCSDKTAYSLILRLREVYIIDCLIKNKIWDNKKFLKLIKSISGSLNAYEGYLRIKNNKKPEKSLNVEEAGKIYDYVLKKLREQEKWAEKRK